MFGSTADKWAILNEMPVWIAEIHAGLAASRG
jgi:hypothetical protein